MNPLQLFRLVIPYRATTHHIVVRAHSHEEAFFEALRLLGLPCTVEAEITLVKEAGAR